jgi:hypothetical protein
MPAIHVVTTGTPTAIASIIETGKPSLKDGKQKRSALARRARTSSAVSSPAN